MIKRAAGRMAFFLTLGVCPFLALPEGASVSDPWHVLNTVTRDTTYVFWQVDGACTTAKISSVDDHSVRLILDSGNQTGGSRLRVIERRNLVRITDLSDDIHHLVYSGRSSWVDIQQLQPLKDAEELLTFKADGRTLNSKSLDVAPNATVFRGSRKTSLLKSDVKAVYYVRLKPLTSNQEFLVEEGATYFDPKLWFRGAFLGKIRVLVYDSSKPEDDSALKCAAQSR